MRVSSLVKRHPLLTFFALAFVFSWTIWLFVPLIANAGVLGPFLSAVLVSAIIAPDRVNGSRPRLWIAFALVLVVAFAVWVLFLPMLPKLFDQYAQLPWYAFEVEGTVSSAVIAFLVLGPLVSRYGVRDLVGRMVLRRADWPWYIAALLLGPALWLLPIGLDLARGGQIPSWSNGVPTLPLVLAAFMVTFLFGGGLEEPGWRGFALPRLQSRSNPLVASVLLGVLWTLWHAPFYFSAIADFTFFFIEVIPLAIIFTWLYNRSERSVLVSILLHTSLNTTDLMVPMSSQASVVMLGTMWATALVFTVSGRMWQHRQADTLEADVCPIALQPAARVSS